MAVFENLQALIDLLGDAPDVAELTLSRPGGEQITIKRPVRSSFPVPPQADAPLRSGASDASSAPSIAAAVLPLSEAGGAAQATAVPAAKPVISDILANRVGIYHPAKPVLELGAEIVSGQIVGYIEAIKLMNEVRAASDGIVSEHFVEDGTPVEYGQPLFRLTSG